MQTFLWAALGIIVFVFAVATQNTCKPAKQLSGKTKREGNYTGITASPLRAKDSVVLKSYKEDCFTVEHSPTGNSKISAPTARANNVSSGSAELPLEYLAVQLLR